MERQRGTLAILLGSQVVQEPTDIGKQEIADLGLVLERRIDFCEGSLHIPVLVRKEKHRSDSSAWWWCDRQ
jgi:hypothetical protein